MKHNRPKLYYRKGLSLIEVVLAVAIFAIFSVGVAGLIIQGLQQNRLAGDQTIATQFASEGLEALQSARNQNFATLAANAGTGIAPVSGVWALSGINNTFDSGKYTRVIKIETVQRDGGGNIVASGGTLDANTFKITSTVSWNFTPLRQNSVVLSTYLTGYGEPMTPSNKKNGFLVYTDSSFGADKIAYKILDMINNSWSTAGSSTTFDVDGAAASNKAPRAIKLYASTTRDEKIILSRHYNGTTQYIYATVCANCSQPTRTFNSTIMSQFNSNSFLDVQNFDGTYLNNGNFLVVYSNNVVTPKMDTWNGTAWVGGSDITSLGANNVPSFIVTRVRPDTNEVMAAFFTQGTGATSGDAVTEYYNGSTWSAITNHSNSSPDRTNKSVDFSWASSDATKGALIYMDSSSDKRMNIRIWTANGSGSGSWATTSNYSTAQSNNLGALSITPVNGSENFITCDKDSLNPQGRYICMRANTTGWVNSSNIIVTAATDPGIQLSFANMSEPEGNPANLISVYSDNTTTVKLKKFNLGANTWDASETNVNSVPVGVIKTARSYSNLLNNNIIFLFTDANLDLFTAGWDSSTHTLISSEALAWTAHGVNGSATTDFWYDFAWDAN